MALAFEKGVFTANTSTGNQTVSLIDTGFGTVKAIMLWTTNLTGEGESSQDAWWSHGFGTYRGSTPQRCAIAAFATDAADPTVTNTGFRMSSILRGYFNGTPSVDFDADLVSLGAAQFVINWTDAPASAMKVHYIALGGSDITDALVSALDFTTGTGNQDFTLASGFGNPELVLATSAQSGTTDVDSTFWNPPFIGAGKSDSEQFVSMYGNSDNQANVLLAAYQKSGLLMAYADGAGTIFFEGALTSRASWPTDGIRVNKVTNGFGGSWRSAVLSLRGTFTSVLGSGTAPTAAPTVDQDLAVGATPRGALFVHNSIAANSSVDITHADLGTWGVGATDGTREGWGGIGDDDAAGAADTHRHHSESKAIRMFTPGSAGTLASEADSSFSGNNVRLSWADTDSVAREYRYVLFGDAPLGAGRSFRQNQPLHLLAR
jgi:hypothetical protein